MGMFDDLRSHPRVSQLTPIPAGQVAGIVAEYPGIPEDYLCFLTEIGHGTVGLGNKCLLAVYSGPISPQSIFGEADARGLSHIALFGDDFSGNPYGFDTKAGWCVVCVNHEDLSVRQETLTFQEFFRGYLRKFG
jgi:hypothetical protein